MAGGCSLLGRKMLNKSLATYMTQLADRSRKKKGRQ